MPAKELAPIVIVDDNRADVEFITRMLIKNGVQNPLHIFLSGEDALDYLFNRAPLIRPKFVLLDLLMPGIGGIEVLRRIRANERTATIPVVVFTGASREESLVETYGLGANVWLEKSFDWNRLFEAVVKLGLIDGMEDYE